MMMCTHCKTKEVMPLMHFCPDCYLLITNPSRDCSVCKKQFNIKFSRVLQQINKQLNTTRCPVCEEKYLRDLKVEKQREEDLRLEIERELKQQEEQKLQQEEQKKIEQEKKEIMKELTEHPQQFTDRFYDLNQTVLRLEKQIETLIALSHERDDCSCNRDSY